MNVFENVAFPLRVQEVNKTDIARRVNEALQPLRAQLPGREHLHQRTHQGGEGLSQGAYGAGPGPARSRGCRR